MLKKLLLSFIILSLELVSVPTLKAELIYREKTARSIKTDTSNFDNNLSGSDTDVQKALETLDELNASSVGAIGGGGTPGKLPVFTGTGVTIGDSIASDDGFAISIAGDLKVLSNTYEWCMSSAPLVHENTNYDMNFDTGQHNTAYVLVERDSVDIEEILIGETEEISSADGINNFGVSLINIPSFSYFITMYFPDDEFADANDFELWLEALIGQGDIVEIPYFKKSIWAANPGADYTWANPDGKAIVSGFTDPPTFKISPVVLFEADATNNEINVEGETNLEDLNVDGETKTYDDVYCYAPSYVWWITSAALVYDNGTGNNNYNQDMFHGGNGFAYIVGDRAYNYLKEIDKGQPEIVHDVAGATEDYGVFLINDVTNNYYITVYSRDDIFTDTADFESWYEAIVGHDVNIDYSKNSMWASNGYAQDYTWANPDNLSIVSGHTDPPTFTAEQIKLLYADTLTRNTYIHDLKVEDCLEVYNNINCHERLEAETIDARESIWTPHLSIGGSLEIDNWNGFLKASGGWVNPEQITPGDIIDFDEASQDAIGSSWQNTSTTNYTYDDALNQMYIDVIADSVQLDTLRDDDNDTLVQVEKNLDEDYIKFDTAGSERMFIDSLGYVSINERLGVLTYPYYPFHLEANALTHSSIERGAFLRYAIYPSSSGSYHTNTLELATVIEIPNGITDNGTSNLLEIYAARDQSADEGAFGSLNGIDMYYGHRSNVHPDARSKYIFGLNLRPCYAQGQVDHLCGLYIGPPETGGTVLNNWGVYVADSNAENYFAGNLSIGEALNVGVNTPGGMTCNGNALFSNEVHLTGTGDSGALYLSYAQGGDPQSTIYFYNDGDNRGAFLCMNAIDDTFYFSPGERVVIQGDLQIANSGTLSVLNMTSPGFVKNDANGVLSGGNSISASDIPEHNGLNALQGGTIDEYYHLTLSQYSDLTDNGDCSIHKHDDRYFTKNESDGRFFNAVGDTITGSCIIDPDTDLGSTPPLIVENDYAITNQKDTVRFIASGYTGPIRNTVLNCVNNNQGTFDGWSEANVGITAGSGGSASGRTNVGGIFETNCGRYQNFGSVARVIPDPANMGLDMEGSPGLIASYAEGDSGTSGNNVLVLFWGNASGAGTNYTGKLSGGIFQNTGDIDVVDGDIEIDSSYYIGMDGAKGRIRFLDAATDEVQILDAVLKGSDINMSGAYKYDGITIIDTNGFIKPKVAKDSEAPLSSVYYSKDHRKLVYKDDTGVVNDLY